VRLSFPNEAGFAARDTGGKTTFGVAAEKNPTEAAKLFT